MDIIHGLIVGLITFLAGIGIGLSIAQLRILRTMRTTVSPGEAAIYLEMRRTLDEYRP